MNIVVIGSSRGIGREVVKQLCQEGHDLLAVSRNHKALGVLEMECSHKPSGSITTLAFDVTDLQYESDDLLRHVTQTFGRIDALLYNAGYLVKKEFADITTSEVMDMFRVNFFSAAAVIRQLLPAMGGENMTHILTIGSMGGFQGSMKFPGLSFYSSSKGALAILSECLALELENKNIRVNCLSPGSAQTEMFSEAFPGYKAQLTASEMAQFVSHFLVHGHKFFNGKILPVSISTP